MIDGVSAAITHWDLLDEDLNQLVSLVEIEHRVQKINQPWVANPSSPEWYFLRQLTLTKLFGFVETRDNPNVPADGLLGLGDLVAYLKWLLGEYEACVINASGPTSPVAEPLRSFDIDVLSEK